MQLLASVPALVAIDISRNKLYSLDERSMARLEFLTIVHLSDNPWACDLCHILPMLRATVNTSWVRSAVCALPYQLRGRPLSSLQVEDLSRCGSGLDFKEEGFAGLALTHRTQLGLIAAGSAVVLVVTMVAVVVGLLYNRKHAAFYYPNEGRKKGVEPPAEKICNGNIDKKVSIATIDEITKDPELEALAPPDDDQLTTS